MRKFTLKFLLAFMGLGFLALQSCKDDSYLAALPPVPDQSFTEEFDTLSTAIAKGWRFANKSVPVGPNNWGPGQRGDANFPPYSSKGTNNGYLSTDYNAVNAAQGLISDWAFSPSIIMQNGDKIIFYTRTRLYAISGDSTDFGNRMQVCMNKYDDELAVGVGYDVGKFNTVLLDINPFYIDFSKVNYDPKAYPSQWTRFEAKVYGLDKPVRGRFAFRYFLEDAGSNGRGAAIGVDSVAYVSVSSGR